MSLLHATSDSFALLAQRTNWHSLGDRFSGDHLRLQTEDLVWAGVLVVFFGGLLALLNWLGHLEKTSRTRPNPKRLFRDLCDAHGLSREQRATLRELAGAKGLSRHDELFVRPEYFCEGAQELRDLRERLFGAGAG